MAFVENNVLRAVFGRTDNIPTDADEALNAAQSQSQLRVKELQRWYVDATGAAGGGEAGGSVDASWDELAEAEAIMRMMRIYRSVDDATAFQQAHVVPLLGQIAQTYASEWTSTFGESNLPTIGKFRRSIISVLIRRPAPVFPPIAEVDRSIQEEFVFLWEAKKWRWRRRPVWMLLNTDGTLDTGDSEIGFDGFASKILHIKDTNKSVTDCVWQDSTRFSALMARYADATDQTGRPKFFYLVPDGSDLPQIQFLPEPDKAYDVFATIYTSAPDLGITLDSIVGLDQMPASFRMHLRDRVIARSMHEYGGDNKDALRFMAKVDRDYMTLLAEFDDQGSIEWNASYYKPSKFIKSFKSFNGRFLGGMG